MNKEEQTDLLKNIDVESEAFDFVAKTVASKAEVYRNEHGRLPYGTWISSLQFQGIYPCIEVQIVDKDGNIYLRRRENNENLSVAEQESWGDKFQIPGTAVISSKRQSSRLELALFGLLEREVAAGSDGSSQKRKNTAVLYRSSEVVGLAMYPEPERKTNAFTVFVRVEVDKEEVLRNDFEIVSLGNVEKVIDQHKPTIHRWTEKRNGKGPMIFDTRFTRKPDED